MLKFVLPYLDEKGFPTEEMCGKRLFFIINNDEPVFADTEKELRELYPDLCQQLNVNTGEIIDVPPKTFVFIGGTIN